MLKVFSVAGPSGGSTGLIAEAQLPPSARFVLKVLESRKYATFTEILEETGLPERTVKHALKRLREAGMVKVVPCITDARRRVYVLCYTPSSGRGP